MWCRRDCLPRPTSSLPLVVALTRRRCLSIGWRSTGQVSPRQIRISVLQLCILITVPQLTLQASIAPLVLRVLLHRALAPILIPRFVHGCFLLTQLWHSQPGWALVESPPFLHSEARSRESAVREWLSLFLL